MKRIFLGMVALVMCLGAMAQEKEAFSSFIQVNGRAEKEFAPNEFYVSITLDEEDSKGRISIEKQEREMVAALKKVGVNTSKQLTYADLSSEYYKRRTSVKKAVYELKLTSSEALTRSWQALDALGISKVAIKRVSHTDMERLKSEVRREAMLNAQTTARELAEAVGQEIGKCFYVYDSNSNYQPRYYNRMMRSEVAYDSAEKGVEPQPVTDFQMIKLEYSVQTKFELK